MKTRELWAVLDSDGCVMWSRGGSSTSKKLMVYSSEQTAERALKSPWIRQVKDPATVTVKCVYVAPGTQ